MTSRLIALAVVISLASGCSTPRLAGINRGEPVAIVMSMAPQAGTNRVNNQVINQDASTGAQFGMAAGAVAGLVAGCGPLVWLCVPIFSIAGMYPGTLVGAGVGIAESLSGEKVAQLTARIDRYREAHDFIDELRSIIIERARKHWQVTDDTAHTVVTIALQEVFLNSTREERLVLVVRVLVSVRSSDMPAGSRVAQKQFEYTGPLSSLSAWVDERSDFIDISFRSASQYLAAQIVSELAAN